MTYETTSKSFTRKTRFYFYPSIALCLVFILLVSVISRQRSLPKDGEPLFEPNVAASHIVAPLDANGDVDYEAYINQESSKGVTSENNAMVKIVEALGPEPDGQTMPQEFYDRLGIGPLTDRNDYFTEFSVWYRNSSFAEDYEDTAEMNARRHWLEWYAKTTAWKADELPEMVAYLKASERTIQLMSEAILRPKYYYPKFPKKPGESLITARLPHIMKMGAMVNLFVLRSNQRLGAGDLNGAINDAATVVKLGEVMSGNNSMVMEELISFSIRGRGYEQLARILHDPQVGQKEMRRLSDVVASFSSTDSIPETLTNGERFIALDAMTYLYRSGDDTFAGLPEFASGKEDPETAMSSLNEQFNQLSELLEQFQSDSTFDIGKAVDTMIEKLKGETDDAAMTKVSRGRRSGKTFAISFLGVCASALRAEDRRNSELQILRLMIALELEKRNVGNYPEKLSELAPNWLQEIPTDPFSRGSEYAYKLTKDGYLLYSIGPNKIDENGSSKNSGGEGDDWRIELKPCQSWEEFVNELDEF